VTDLRVKVDENWEGGHEPTPEELQAVSLLFPDLDNETPAVRRDAQAALTSHLQANPGLKPTYIAAKQGLKAEGQSAIDAILASYAKFTDFYFDGNSRLNVVHNSDDTGPAGTTYIVLVAYPDWNDVPLSQDQNGTTYVELVPNFGGATAPRPFIPKSVGDTTVTVTLQYRDADDDILDEVEITLPVHVYEP
jgi:hypothetical protein